MDIKRLNHFIALAEEGRFALAATRVHLSQAAFSRSIQALEDSIGLRLFDRGAKGAALTPAGAVVLARARDLVFDSRCLQRDIALVKTGDAGELSIGAAPIPAAVLIPDMLCQMLRTSPQLVTRVHRGNLAKLLEQLEAQDIDFCLGDPRLVAKSARLQMVSVGKQQGGLYCRRGHPLARKAALKAALDVADIARFGVAMISISPALLDGLAAGLGFTSAAAFPRAVECDDISTLVHLVQQTDVLGLLPQAVAARHVKTLRALPSRQSQLAYADIYAIWLKGRTQSPSALRAIALAQKLSIVPHTTHAQ